MNIQTELQVRDEAFEQWYGEYFQELARENKHNIVSTWENAWAEAWARAYSISQNTTLKILV